MFDGLLKSKFYTKCKENVKLTKTHAETIRRKKMVVLNILKNDIADLLKNGHDKHAYDRTESFLVDQNMTSCYELVENFCVTLANDISLVEKQRECPDQCREAVASLIYAAARFSDLPELRHLRSIMEEKYGNSLETYTSKEFIGRLSPKTYTKEIKLQLLQDIANEFSIRCNSKALEQNLFSPSAIQNQAENVDNNDNKGEKKYVSQRRTEKDSSPRNPKEQGNKMAKRTETDKGRYKAQSSSSDDESTVISWNERKTSSSTAASISYADADSRTTPFQGGRIRPPYQKPKPEKSPSLEDDKPKPRSVRQRSSQLKPPLGYDNAARWGLKVAEEDEEEVMLDDLLMHYSHKKPYYEPTAESVRGRRQELPMRPSRVASLPSNQSTMLERGPTRLASFQPEGHTHSKLPGDYNEFIARFAALNGK